MRSDVGFFFGDQLGSWVSLDESMELENSLSAPRVVRYANFCCLALYLGVLCDLVHTIHAQIEKNSVSGESRGRSSSIVLEFRHRQIGGFTLHSVGEGQLNYASAKTTNSSTVIPIRMSLVECLSHGLKGREVVAEERVVEEGLDTDEGGGGEEVGVGEGGVVEGEVGRGVVSDEDGFGGEERREASATREEEVVVEGEARRRRRWSEKERL
ncbi:hypothetical protein LR48_Vigan03g153500 [Vigna angularis]|uniref:Uncharacterized protein n=1 Tax=Phaseolus angularis TaxID=3914 RepID=A0A0L9U5P5_PHAAN|nr:hypothetical protein LR48_Vigan03g153500 [Vigna angularis]